MAAKPAAPQHYTDLCKLLFANSTLSTIDSVLNWDQETYMPPAAGEFRAEQQSALSSIVHERRTSSRVGELLAQCEADATLTTDARTAANLREIRRDYDRMTKLPTGLVAEISLVQSQSQEAWKKARAANNFKAFQPWLEKIVVLMRRKAECYGTPASGELYDNLLDQYEPDMTAREIEAIFEPLRPRLSELVTKITKSKVKISDDAACIGATVAQQDAFARHVLKAIGFDLNAGRLDTTTHPFCSTLGSHDIRLTTRYGSPSFLEALSSTMHEAGHGLYEQGLPTDQFMGQPLADAVSLGIHESQSRMWENFVGRSRAFWAWATPVAKKHFGKPMKATPEQLFRAANTVQRSLIRVEADEATYNLHVMLRFKIERALIGGQLSTKDLPGVWNSTFKDYLGVKVPSDAKGCMQDVHWSFGLVGYFPTYTLGNLYAAQLWEKINDDIPTLNKQMSKGKFDELLKWLRTNIHQHGRRYTATELCKRATGKPLSPEPLMRHLQGKLGELYKI